MTGIGISVPGIVATSGIVLSAPYLGWRDVDLQSLVARGLKSRWPVKVINDASALAQSVLADRPDQKVRDALLLLLAEGIGSAQIRQGQIVSGAHGLSGEVGHMILAKSIENLPTETFEKLAGYNALLPALSRKVSIADGLAALSTDRRSAKATRLLSNWSRALSVGLHNLIHIHDPERIILGGPLRSSFPSLEKMSLPQLIPD